MTNIDYILIAVTCIVALFDVLLMAFKTEPTKSIPEDDNIKDITSNDISITPTDNTNVTEENKNLT